MTSVRACYCGQEGCAFRKVDDDVEARDGNRHRRTVVSRRSVIRNEARGSNGESPRRAIGVIDERKPGVSRSIEPRSIDPVLSPETSTAIENAERIVNSAKIQLMEVRAMSYLDSARRNGNTCSDEPPLDDEAEALLYVRELVAAKFQETNNGFPVPGTDTRPEVRRVDARVTVRRVDLSAPRFRTVTQRRADRTFPAAGIDERRSRGRCTRLVEAPSASSPSTDSPKDPPSKDTAEDEGGATRDRRSVRAGARRNPCRIQTGPSVRVDGDLTRQDLANVHISPEPSLARDRANTATYTLRHGASVIAVAGTDQPEVPRDASVVIERRARLGTSLREENGGGPIVEVESEAAEAAAETITTRAPGESRDYARNAAGDEGSDPGRGDGRTKSPQLQDPVRQEGEGRKDRETASRDGSGARALEHVERACRETTDVVVIERTRTGNENRVGISHRDDIENRVNDRSRGKGNTVDETKAENRDDRGTPYAVRPYAGDVSRRADAPRREDVAARRRATEGTGSCRTIDERPAFSSYDDLDESYDIAAGEIRPYRSSVPCGTDDSRADDKPSAIELYRPRLDDLDSILLTNERRIGRAVRAVDTLAELLSEFAKYRPAEDERAPRQADRFATNPRDGEWSSPSSADRTNSLTTCRSSTARSIAGTQETRIRDPTVSSASEARRADAGLRGASTDTTEACGGVRKANDTPRGDYSGRSVESTAYPASDEDEARPSTAKERPSEFSTDRSELATFSDIPPALSSTRRETRTSRGREERVSRAKSGSDGRGGRDRADPWQREFTYANMFSKRAIDSSSRRARDVLARVLRGLKDDGTVDRFVACVLPDERRSVGRRMTGVLRSIGDARRTATLAVLEDILTSIKNGTVDDVNGQDDERVRPRKVESAPSSAIAKSMLREAEEEEEEEEGEEEDSRETRPQEVGEIGRIAEHPRDLKSPDKRSSVLLPDEGREIRENDRSANNPGSVWNPRRSGSENERHASRRTGTSDVMENTSTAGENRADEAANVDANDDANYDDGRIRCRDELAVRTSATEGSIPREGSARRTEATVDAIDRIVDGAGENPRGAERRDDSSDLRPVTRAENVRLEARPGSVAVSENDEGGGGDRSGSGSLKRIPEIRSDREENLDEDARPSPACIAPVKPNEMEAEAEIEIATSAAYEDKKDGTSDERRGCASGDTQDDKDAAAAAAAAAGDQRTYRSIAPKITGRTDDAPSGLSRETLDAASRTEIATGKTRDDDAPLTNKETSLPDIPGAENERAQAATNHGLSRSVDESAARGASLVLANLLTESDAESPRAASGNDAANPRQNPAIVTNGGIGAADTRSADSPRDGASLRAASDARDGESPARVIEPRDKKAPPSRDITEGGGEETRGKSVTIEAATRNRGDGNERPAIATRARDDNGQRRTIGLASGDSPSSSVSSVFNGTSLEHDGGCSDDALSSGNANGIGSPSVTSHSEGELYMPSSCSYSLGEVRLLEKRDLIADRTTDRDSSVTFLVTRSMLTSLNDSAATPLGSSARI